MTLQERILEALHGVALKPDVIYRQFSGDLASAVDFALRAMVRDGLVRRVDGRFERAQSQRATNTAPSAAVKKAATAEAGPSAKERPKEEVKPQAPAPRITLSPALIATLVKLQHAKAETLMALCAREDMVRQELAALEEVIRIATAKEGGG